MDILARLIELEQRLRQFVLQKVATVVYVAPYTLTSSDGRGDGIDGRPDDQSSQRDVHRAQHAGFRSRPLVQAQAVALLAEGSATKMLVVAEDDGAAVDLDEGEAKVYSPAKPGCRIWLDKDGVLHIDADSGQDIILNGGSLKVARDTDPTVNGTLAMTTVGPVMGVTTCTILWTPPGGGAPQTVGVFAIAGAATAGSASLTGKINGGADHVKG